MSSALLLGKLRLRKATCYLKALSKVTEVVGPDLHPDSGMARVQHNMTIALSSNTLPCSVLDLSHDTMLVGKACTIPGPSSAIGRMDIMQMYILLCYRLSLCTSNLYSLVLQVDDSRSFYRSPSGALHFPSLLCWDGSAGVTF